MMPAGRRTKIMTLENPGARVPDGAGGYRMVARVQADEWAKIGQ